MPQNGRRARLVVEAAWWWLPVAAYMAVIFYLSSLSAPPLAGLAPDYYLHFLEFAGLAVLVARALNRGIAVTSFPLVLVAAAVAYAYGVTDEAHQFFIPFRDASLHDLRSDLVGSVAGALSCYVLGRNFRPGAGARIMGAVDPRGAGPASSPASAWGPATRSNREP